MIKNVTVTSIVADMATTSDQVRLPDGSRMAKAAVLATKFTVGESASITDAEQTCRNDYDGAAPENAVEKAALQRRGYLIWARAQRLIDAGADA